MTRMSSLPLAEKCGAAASLSARHGSGRPAAMSKAFHAKCAGAPEAFRLIGALSHAERDEIAEWKAPADALVNDLVTLDYPSAAKELEVGLDVFGEFVDIAENALTWGHLDFAWLREVPIDEGSGLLVAFVADIKKSVWTTPDGPESLQIHAYGRAFAKKVGAQAYCTGIWAAKEGKWLWSTEIIHLDGPRAQEIWERISFAASNTGEASTGRHCDSCFARMHCPEYLLPGAITNRIAPEASLAISEEQFAGLMLTPGEAVRLLVWAKRAQELGEAVEKNLREAVRRGQLVIEQDGKVWTPVEMPASAFTVNKQAHVQMRWKKAR